MSEYDHLHVAQVNWRACADGSPRPDAPPSGRAMSANEIVVWVAAADRDFRLTVPVARWGQPDDASKERLTIGLPKQCPEWLVQRLQQGEVDRVRLGVRATGNQEVRLWGLAKVSTADVRFHSGVLFNPDDEGKLLCKVYCNPHDAAFLRIVDAVSLVEPLSITHRTTDSNLHRLMFLCRFCLCAVAVVVVVVAVVVGVAAVFLRCFALLSNRNI